MEKNVKIAGVSLIEVMISMVLIALLLIAIVSVFPRMASHSKGMQESEQAKLIAGEVLEKLQVLSEDITLYPCNSLASEANDTFVRDAVTYHTTLSASVCNGTPNTVTVMVNWTKSGKPHKILVTGAVR